MPQDRNRRPINAAKILGDAVNDVKKDIAKAPDEEVADGLIPFARIADLLAARRKAKRQRVRPALEAAE